MAKTPGDPDDKDAGKKGDPDAGKGEGGEDVAKLQDELGNARKALHQANEEAKNARLELKKYRGVDPEKYQALLDEQSKREEEAAKAAGDFEALREKLVQERDTWKTKFEGEVQDRKREKVNNALLAAAADPEVRAINGSQILAVFGSQFKVTDDGAIVPTDPTMLDADSGKPMTPKQFLIRQREDGAGNLFHSSLNGGSGAGGGGSSDSSKVKISRTDPHKVRKYEQAIKDSKQVEWTA